MNHKHKHKLNVNIIIPGFTYHQMHQVLTKVVNISITNKTKSLLQKNLFRYGFKGLLVRFQNRTR